MSRCTLTCNIPAPVDRFAELMRTTLARGGWRIELVNDDFKEITAQMVKTERAGGTVWNYEYHMAASWSSAPSGVDVELEVCEEKNAWSVTACRSYCEQLEQGLLERAQKLERTQRTHVRSTAFGKAKWASIEDIQKADYCGGNDDSRRFILSPGVDQEYVTLTPEDSDKHVITVGATGTGKTTAIFVPNLIERLQTSVIVTEATAGNEAPDLYSKTATWRAMHGQKIYYFNPDDLSSDRINPIDSVYSYADAQSLAQLIIENTTSKNSYGDDVWPKSEANLLTILVAHAASIGENLGYVRRILRDGPDGLTAILCNSQVEQVREEYRGFGNTARDGFKYGVVAGLTQRLALWVNPRICALTETTDIDLNDLPNQLFSFYLAVPAQKTHLKPVAALIFNFVLEQALKQHFHHPLYLSLDEFTNFGLIPAIAQKLSIIRHKKIGAVMGVQDFVQLQQIYGKDDATLIRSQPGCKIFFRPRTRDVAQSMSELAGMTTVVDRKVGSSGQINERESGRPLLDIGDALSMSPDEMVAFTAGADPMRLPRFTWQDYDDVTSLPPFQKTRKIINEEITKPSTKKTVEAPIQEQQIPVTPEPEYIVKPLPVEPRMRTPEPQLDGTPDKKQSIKKTAAQDLKKQHDNDRVLIDEPAPN